MANFLVAALVIVALLAASPQRSAAQECAVPSRPVIYPHKQNYVIVSNHSVNPRDVPPEENSFRERLQNEVAFQFSAQTHLWDCWCPVGAWSCNEAHFAFTQRAFWQIFDDDPDDGNVHDSRQFREFNFNPEIFFVLLPASPFTLHASFFDHESNGAGSATSRSLWRNYLRGILRMEGGHEISLKYWNRNRILDSGEDENPDLVPYLGHWEGLYAVSGDDTGLRILLRKGKLDPQGTVQIDFTVAVRTLIPGIDPGMYFHFHAFNGFGESLIDHEHRVTRLGVGFSFREAAAPAEVPPPPTAAPPSD